MLSMPPFSHCCVCVSVCLHLHLSIWQSVCVCVRFFVPTLPSSFSPTVSDDARVHPPSTLLNPQQQMEVAWDLFIMPRFFLQSGSRLFLGLAVEVRYQANRFIRASGGWLGLSLCQLISLNDCIERLLDIL